MLKQESSYKLRAADRAGPGCRRRLRCRCRRRLCILHERLSMECGGTGGLGGINYIYFGYAGQQHTKRRVFQTGKHEEACFPKLAHAKAPTHEVAITAAAGLLLLSATSLESSSQVLQFHGTTWKHGGFRRSIFARDQRGAARPAGEGFGGEKRQPGLGWMGKRVDEQESEAGRQGWVWDGSHAQVRPPTGKGKRLLWGVGRSTDKTTRHASMNICSLKPTRHQAFERVKYRWPSLD